jgi:predicted Zn-dependent protease
MYSSLDMNMHLNAAETIPGECSGVQCDLNASLDRQVKRLGARLSTSAYEIYPDLKQRVPTFQFEVAEKAQPGTTSNASGTIIIYRGVRNPKMDEGVLAFLISREMGHVIARHHDEKSATGMLFSLVAQVFLPVVNVTRGIAALASSAASMWGSDAVSRDKGAEQANEADRIAYELLARQGWTIPDLADSLFAYSQGLRSEAWADSIRVAAAHCAREKLMLAIAALPPPPALQFSEAQDTKLRRPAFAKMVMPSSPALPGAKLPLFSQFTQLQAEATTTLARR